MTTDEGGMPYNDFLNAVIDDGIEECREAYPGAQGETKREGAIRGFEDCRGKRPDGLLDLQAEADRTVHAKMRDQAPDYWFWRLRALQVEWVLNVLSAAEYAQGRPPHTTPTARGLEKAMAILDIGPGARPEP